MANDIMKEIVVLEWTFAPLDYFEQPIHIIRDNYEMTIDKGKVEARIEAQYFDSEPDFQMKLHELLKSRFYGASILNQKPFELSKPSMYRIHPDGRKSFTLFAEPGAMRVTGGNADLIVTGPDGKVISDSRQERIEKRNILAERVEKYRTQCPVLQGILKSWHSSFLKPENELVYLYEVRDALSEKFGGCKKACRVLKVNEDSWNTFGGFANDPSLEQGRHRGRNVGSLREATEDELTEARTFIRELIEKYLDYLESNQHP